jgi:hypothetical protein
MAQIVAVVDREVRDRLERAQVDLLPLGSMRIVRPGADRGGEVPDPIDAVLGEQPCAQLAEVEPAVWRPFEAAVVEVERVDVDVRRLSAPYAPYANPCSSWSLKETNPSWLDAPSTLVT